MSRQRGLLLDKLEVFKRINKSVRQQLKELQDQEVCVAMFVVFVLTSSNCNYATCLVNSVMQI